MRSSVGYNRTRYTVLATGTLVATALGATPLQTGQGTLPSPVRSESTALPDTSFDLSLMTYNVKGLPWPIAQD